MSRGQGILFLCCCYLLGICLRHSLCSSGPVYMYDYIYIYMYIYYVYICNQFAHSASPNWSRCVLWLSLEGACSTPRSLSLLWCTEVSGPSQPHIDLPGNVQIEQRWGDPPPRRYIRWTMSSPRWPRHTDLFDSAKFQKCKWGWLTHLRERLSRVKSVQWERTKKHNKHWLDEFSLKMQQVLAMGSAKSTRW